jgi:hypothetical protein
MSKVESRRRASRQAAKALLEAIAGGQADAYEGYRQLYGIWCSNNAAVLELRPLFQMPGIEPDGMLSVTAEFREQVASLAKAILQKFED